MGLRTLSKRRILVKCVCIVLPVAAAALVVSIWILNSQQQSVMDPRAVYAHFMRGILSCPDGNAFQEEDVSENIRRKFCLCKEDRCGPVVEYRRGTDGENTVTYTGAYFEGRLTGQYIRWHRDGRVKEMGWNRPIGDAEGGITIHPRLNGDTYPIESEVMRNQ